MRAELVGIDAGRPRWRFTLGCLRVVATRPAVWRYAGYGVLLVGAVAATVRWTGQVGYGPLRVVLVGTVAALVVVAVLGRVRPLGPVAHSRAGRGVRAFGYVLVGALAAEEVAFFAHQNRSSVDGEQVLAVMFVVLLLGFLALTAQRSSVTSTTLIVGVLAGCAAAAGWTAVVVVSPPIPSDVGLAILVTALAIGAAVLAASRWGGARAGLLAGTCAGTVAALLILHVVLVLSVVGPARFIPDLVPAALSPADDVANSRIEIQDPYMWMLLVAALSALVQCVVSLVVRQSDPDEGEDIGIWLARVRLERDRPL